MIQYNDWKNYDNFKVNGIARDFVLSGLNLHDGVTYYVTVISCNGAKICTSSTSSGILVDSTPPTRGMYLNKSDILFNDLYSLLLCIRSALYTARHAIFDVSWTVYVTVDHKSCFTGYFYNVQLYYSIHA
jgi:hypothetical protein